MAAAITSYGFRDRNRLGRGCTKDVLCPSGLFIAFATSCCEAFYRLEVSLYQRV
jgi:hypothetical protein